MPWRLIEFIVVFAVFLFFIVCNLENKCDISFGFRVIKDTPVFLTAFSSFIFGMLCSVPFIIGAKVKRRVKKTDDSRLKPRGSKKEITNGEAGKDDSGGPYGID
jgi:uncharacterized integral membrane protein